MKVGLNHAQQLVRDMMNPVDVSLEQQAAHVTLICALPALVEIALAAEKLVACKGRYHTELNYADLVGKLQALKELPDGP